MATILPFVIRPRATSSVRLPASDAAIVIFPGIRYEPVRSDGPDEHRKAAGAAARKRKSKTV